MTYTTLMLLVVVYRMYMAVVCFRSSAGRAGKVAHAPSGPSATIANGDSAADDVQRKRSRSSATAAPPTMPTPSKQITEAKDWAGELISGQTLVGRVIVVMVFLLSMGSMAIYVHDTTV